MVGDMQRARRGQRQPRLKGVGWLQLVSALHLAWKQRGITEIIALPCFSTWLTIHAL